MTQLENKRFTEKESMVIKAIISHSNFNSSSLDLSLSWDEQRLEDCDHYWCFADVKDYGCGMSKQETRGVFGSLSKKNCIQIVDDEDVWIAIDENNFNIIKEYLKG